MPIFCRLLRRPLCPSHLYPRPPPFLFLSPPPPRSRPNACRLLTLLCRWCYCRSRGGGVWGGGGTASVRASVLPVERMCGGVEGRGATSSSSNRRLEVRGGRASPGGPHAAPQSNRCQRPPRTPCFNKADTDRGGGGAAEQRLTALVTLAGAAVGGGGGSSRATKRRIHLGFKFDINVRE